MMNKSVAYRDLEQALVRMGFVPQPTTGTQKLFAHQSSDALVMLPPYSAQDSVSPAHVIAIRRVVTEKGVIEADAFDRLLAST